jgi:threonyl-tRNA synthetase
MPERLGLEFIGADNQPHQPIIIHRAPLSTHERMIAFLIEKTAGAFPTWLSPVQVALIPVSEKSTEYAQSIQKKLKDAFVRVELDNSQETMGKRLRNAIQKKIPHILICGEKEAAEQTVSLRSLSGKQKTLSFEDFFASLLDCIQNRKDISLCD